MLSSKLLRLVALRMMSRERAKTPTGRSKNYHVSQISFPRARKKGWRMRQFPLTSDADFTPCAFGRDGIKRKKHIHLRPNQIIQTVD